MILCDLDYYDIPTSTGLMRTHLFRPAMEGEFPGVLLYSEIFQVTGPIRRLAAFLAGHGYLVAVPEVYHEYEPAGAVLAYDTAGAERGNELKITKPITAYDSDARATVDFLKQHPNCNGKLGALGVCLGGHLAFRAAMNLDVLATACFYATDIHQGSLGLGKKDGTLERICEIRGELLMIWGRQDPHISPEGRGIIYRALEAEGTTFQWHEFNAAHAFMRDEGPRFNPALATICNQLVLELFQRKLRQMES